MRALALACAATLCLALVSVSARAADVVPSPAGNAEALCREAEDLFAVGDLEGLEAARDAREPGFWRAFANYRLAAARLQFGQRDSAMDAIRDGLAAMDATADPLPASETERQVLTGMLEGLHLMARPSSFVGSARRALRAFNAAERAEPDNPRLRMARGVFEFLVPWIFGGRDREAVEDFEIGLAAFEDRRNCTDGAWGKRDLRIWMARVQRKLGNEELALAQFALLESESPNNIWAQRVREGLGYTWSDITANASAGDVTGLLGRSSDGEPAADESRPTESEPPSPAPAVPQTR